MIVIFLLLFMILTIVWISIQNTFLAFIIIIIISIFYQYIFYSIKYFYVSSAPLISKDELFNLLQEGDIIFMSTTNESFSFTEWSNILIYANNGIPHGQIVINHHGEKCTLHSHFSTCDSNYVITTHENFGIKWSIILEPLYHNILTNNNSVYQIFRHPTPKPFIVKDETIHRTYSSLYYCTRLIGDVLSDSNIISVPLWKRMPYRPNTIIQELEKNGYKHFYVRI